MRTIEDGLDINKLRNYDIPHVQKIMSYLKRYNLDIKSVGSVLNGTKSYEDIDLVVIGSEKNMNMIIKEITKSNTIKNTFRKRIGNNCEIEYNNQYVYGTSRGEIKIGVEETKIHLILESLENRDPLFPSMNT